MAGRRGQEHKTRWNAEHQHGVARKAELGNTHTPYALAGAIVRQFLDTELRCGDAGDRWLEPAVGSGNFYLAALERAQELGRDALALARRFDALDVDAQALEVLRARLGERFGWSDEIIAGLPIHHCGLETFGSGLLATPGAGGGYRVIVTNPPYLAARNWATTAPAREAMRKRWDEAVGGVPSGADLFMYFFHWCNRHLAPGGASVLLCSDGWLDSEYGSSLRAALAGGNDAGVPVLLETVAAWPWTALFRDDTCPIVTVVRRCKNPDDTQAPTRLIVDDGDPLAPHAGPAYVGSTQRLQVERLDAPARAQWLSENNSNRRQIIVSGPRLHRRLDRALEAVRPACARLDEIANVRGFSWTLNSLADAGLLLAQPGATGRLAQDDTVPDADAWARAQTLFFQKQARVGKPVDYRPQRQADDFGCRVLLDEAGSGKEAGDLAARIARGGACRGGAWMALAIDRLPLLFYADSGDVDKPLVGLSKYAHISLKSAAGQTTNVQADGSPAAGLAIDAADAGPLLCALACSTPALLAMDRWLKEGTRKTLRVNENGYAKELTRGAVAGLAIPDPRRWSAAQLSRIVRLARVRGERNISRLDEAVADESWLALDDAIGEACGFDLAQMQQWRELAVALYWRRMRNLLRYGAAQSAVFESGNWTATDAAPTYRVAPVDWHGSDVLTAGRPWE